MDLEDLARRLDREEVLHLRYRCPLRSPNGEGQRYEEREGLLLDVAPELGRLFVRCESEVIWITDDEAIAVLEDRA